MLPASYPGKSRALRVLLVWRVGVMSLHHPCPVDLMFLELPLLLTGCWAPVQVGPWGLRNVPKDIYSNWSTACQ